MKIKKNKKFKNNVLFLLVGLFALSLFTACSQENSKEDEVIEPKKEEKEDIANLDIREVTVELDQVKLADGMTFKDHPKREDIVKEISGIGLIFLGYDTINLYTQLGPDFKVFTTNLFAELYLSGLGFPSLSK